MVCYLGPPRNSQILPLLPIKCLSSDEDCEVYFLIITIFTQCSYFWWIPADVRVWRVEVEASQLVLSTALIITTSSLIGTLIPYRLNQYSIIIINRYPSGFTLLIYLLWVAPIRPSWLGSSSRHRRYALHRKNSQSTTTSHKVWHTILYSASTARV